MSMNVMMPVKMMMMTTTTMAPTIRSDKALERWKRCSTTTPLSTTVIKARTTATGVDAAKQVESVLARPC